MLRHRADQEGWARVRSIEGDIRCERWSNFVGTVLGFPLLWVALDVAHRRLWLEAALLTMITAVLAAQQFVRWFSIPLRHRTVLRPKWWFRDR